METETFEVEIRSDLFSLFQPDGYSQTDYLIELEKQHTDKLIDYLDEKILVKYPLGFEMKIPRRFLPKDHPEWTDSQGYYEICQKAYLDGYTKAWVDTLQTFVKENVYGFYKGEVCPIEMIWLNTDSPRFYNFEMDKANFKIKMPMTEFERIKKEVIENHLEDFEDYTARKDSDLNYDGHISLLPNNTKKIFAALNDPDDFEFIRSAGCFFDFYFLALSRVTGGREKTYGISNLKENKSLFEEMFAEEALSAEENGSLQFNWIHDEEY